VNFGEYKRAVPRTLPPDPMHPAGSLPILALGLCEEWLEFIQSRDADGRGCGKELGDVLWYIVATAERIGMLEHVCIVKSTRWLGLDLWAKADENLKAACMVAGMVKKHASNGKPLDVDGIFALLQKMLHNFNSFVQLTTMSFEQVLDANVQKGLDRYPNGWIDVFKEEVPMGEGKKSDVLPLENGKGYVVEHTDTFPFPAGSEAAGSNVARSVFNLPKWRTDTVDGTDRPPARYTQNGRETLDTMRDRAYAEAERQLGPGPLADLLADLLFAFHCEATALKYSDRSGSKGDAIGDAKKCAFYRQMAAHVRSPGQYPDPRCLRPGFRGYTRQPVVEGSEWSWHHPGFGEPFRRRKVAEEPPPKGVEVLGFWREENRFDVVWLDQDADNVWVSSDVWNVDAPDEWTPLLSSPPRDAREG